MTGIGRLIVVSNRLPVTVRRVGKSWRAVRNPGGLVSALDPVMRERDGLWIGWPGEAPVDDDGEYDAVLSRWLRDHDCARVDLPAGDPPRLLRGLFQPDPVAALPPVLVAARVRSGRLGCLRPGQRAVPRRRAGAPPAGRSGVDPRLPPDAAARASFGKQRRDARIAFFLHIPFPSSDVFRLLPRRDELLSGLLGADAVAFHTHDYLQHFRHCLLRILGLGSRMDCVDTGSRVVSARGPPDRHRGGRVRRPGGAAIGRCSAAITDLRQRFAGQRRPARRRPPRLHQGHPRAAPNLPLPAASRIRNFTGRSCWSRWPFRRGRRSPTTPSSARR